MTRDVATEAMRAGAVTRLREIAAEIETTRHNYELALERRRRAAAVADAAGVSRADIARLLALNRSRVTRILDEAP